MKQAVMRSRREDRSQRYYGYGCREQGLRMHGFGSARPNGSHTPPARDEYSYYDATSFRGARG